MIFNIIKTRDSDDHLGFLVQVDDDGPFWCLDQPAALLVVDDYLDNIEETAPRGG